MYKLPFPSSLPMSPVQNQPSSVNDSLVASGLLRYEIVLLGLRMQISPSCPTSTAASG